VAAVVHPLNSTGSFDSGDADSRFVIGGSYFKRRRYADAVDRNGLKMTFESRHWTLEDYLQAVIGAGLRIDAVREVADEDDARWRRMPLFLHLRAVKADVPRPARK
jgi:hypothetical protein